MRGISLCAIAFLAMLGMQLAEGASQVIGTFKQQSEKTFVPHAYVKAETIDFGQTYDDSAHAALKFTTTTGAVAYNATSGFYETSGTGVVAGRLTFPQKFPIKLVVSPAFTTPATWTQWSKPASTVGVSQKWCAIAHDGAKLYAIGNTTGVVVTSSDGEIWAKWPDATRAITANAGAGLTTTNWLSAIYWNGKLYLMEYNTGTIAYSADGVNWNKWTTTAKEGSGLSSGGWFSICHDDEKLYAVEYASGKVVCSSNGASWTPLESLGAKTGTYGWQSMTYCNGRLYAINCATGVVKVSSDGGNSWNQWEKTTIAAGGAGSDWHDITNDNEGNLYFVEISSGVVMISRDGKIWNKGSVTKNGNGKHEFYYLNGKFYTITFDTSGTVCVYQEQKNGKLTFTNIAGNTSEHAIDSPTTFYIDPLQMAAENTITFNMTNIRLTSAEISRAPLDSDKIASLPFDASYKSEVNIPGNQVVAAIDFDGANLLTSRRIDFSVGSTITANFVSASAGDSMIPLGVRANLGTALTELKGDWTRYQDSLFETSGSGTLKIATAASLPQSNVTIRDRGSLQFASGLEVTTGANTTLDLRGCSGVSSGKSLTLGARARLIF